MGGSDEIIDEATGESFPASDPPVWTPVTGTGDPHAQGTMVHVEDGRGEDLRQHLAGYGIDATVRPAEYPSGERVEVHGGMDRRAVQAVVDRWPG